MVLLTIFHHCRENLEIQTHKPTTTRIKILVQNFLPLMEYSLMIWAEKNSGRSIYIYQLLSYSLLKFTCQYLLYDNVLNSLSISPFK